ESFFSAPQLKRDPLGGKSEIDDMPASPLKQSLLWPTTFIFLIVCAPQEGQSRTKGWKIYADTAHDYQFSYPPNYEIDSTALGLSLKRGDTSTAFYIEDWTKSVRRGETHW